VAGCRIPDCTVLPEFNKLNPDMANEKYNTELGIYQPHCGLENVKFAYGHDEYMYQMMVSPLKLVCKRASVFLWIVFSLIGCLGGQCRAL
jgi:hypothetical protein